MSWLAAALLALAALGAVAGLLSLWAVRARFDQPETVARPRAVTVLRPLYGAEPGLAARLQMLVEQDYAAPVQLLFGVQSVDDSAIAVVQAMQLTHPQVDITLVVDGQRHGSNAKVANLINMAHAARHAVLVVSDSDIAVSPDWLRRVTDPLSTAATGAVTALYTGQAGVPGLWARLTAMGSSYQFLPGVALGAQLRLAHPCMGSTIAMTRATLDKVGGFERLANVLADDYELGRAVRALGLKVAMPAVAVRHMHFETSLRMLWRQELRWMRTVRMLDAKGHAGQLVTFGVPLAAAGALLTGFAPAALGILTVALGVRGLQKYRIDRATGTNSGPVWLLPVRDVLSLAVWAGSYCGRRVDWRGATHLAQPAR